MFVVLEGIDGSGTTTQAQQLAQRLRQHRLDPLVTAEPSTGYLGLLLRQALRREITMSQATLALLFAADRLEHLANEIVPALAQGRWVVCDRYVMSSWAYQSLTLPVEWVRAINGRSRLPDVTLFFDVDPEVAASRRQARGEPAQHFDAAATQRRVAQNYAALAAADTTGNVIHIDANRSLPVVHAACWAALEPRLQLR